MTDYVFTAPSLAVADSTARFPVRRVFCVGRNYAAHAREMSNDPTRERNAELRHAPWPATLQRR